MKSKPQTEAVLERSLRKQVKVRQLDASFDSSVWARIAAEESKSAAPLPARPAASKARRWVFMVNALGIASVAVVLCVFLFQWLAGVQVETTTIPDFTARMSDQSASQWSTGIAGAALLFGFFYTPWARRLRDELF